MASFLGLNGAKAARPIQYSGLNVSSSKMDAPVTIFWGTRRLATNAIWYNDFKKHSQSKGGKGGGKGGQYDYSAAVIVGLCEGPIDLVQNVWSATSTTTTSSLSKLNLTLFTGTAVQAPWSFVSTNYPAQARSYALTAYLASPKMDLGNTAEVPDNQFECQRLMSFGYTHTTTKGYINPTTLTQSGGVDVLMSDVVPDFLTNTQYGMGFVSGDIGDVTQYGTYCRAQGIFLSPVVDSQDKASSVIDRWAQLTNSWIYWSGTQLLFYPLADQALTGNGVTFTPDNDVAYSLSLANGDFMGDPPVKVTRVDPALAYNRTRIAITDRVLGYVSNPIEYKDQTLVDQYGLRDNTAVDGKDICDRDVGLVVAQLIGKRAAYLRNTYAFTTSFRYIRCLPGTVLELTEPNIGLANTRVRVQTVQENDDGSLQFLCEEFPGTIATYGAFDPGLSSVPTAPDLNIDPGDVNTPSIIEPSSAFTGNKAKLLVTASGGANWGGCQVWLSFDLGSNFIHAGDITAAGAQGTLTAILPSHADPDTVDTLSVDCTESLTTLPVVTNADADALRTLTQICAQPTLSSGIYVMPTNGELLAWGANSATGTYSSDLSYLRRAQYGTVAAAHSIGDQFSVVDVLGTTGTTFSYDLPAQYIGQPIHVKLLSFNNFGNAVQDISTVKEYSYTPTGAGYGAGSGGVPATPTGLAAAPGVQSALLSWNANAATDNVTAYQIWRASGTGAAFGSASQIATVSGLNYSDAGLAAGTGYTYFLVAVNSVGSSTNTAGVDLTTPSGSLGPPSAQIVASENLAAGDLVNIYTSAGAARVQKADATDAAKPAHGFVTAAVSSGATATVFGPGQFNSAVSGLTPGTTYYLDTTAGAVTATAPSGAGNVIQPVGQATAAASLLFDPEEAIQL